MIKALIDYSAVTAKARAMYGKFLTAADWEQLLDASGLREIRELLRRSGAWSAAMEAAGASEDAETLSAALRQQLSRDCDSLCLYLSKADQETLRFFLRRPDGSMTPEEARRWWNEGGKRFAGLRRIAGAEADALNLVYILRLRRFPGSLPEAEKLLIPVRDKLTPRLVQGLLRARDDRAVLDILADTPWGGAFTSLAPGDLERQYGDYMAAFCRRLLTEARPGLPAVQAFLTLKDMERARLDRVIGAAARGIDPHLAV